jgi:cyclophilin family peptidyl-prolyl cis-trans isomerase
MKAKIFIILLSALTVWSCKTNEKQSSTKETEVVKNSFIITTPFGQMKGRLYDETPLHRDNFTKLVNEGYYDSLLFHRVIQNFMIQGGDPESKNAPKGKQLGNGGPDYTIPAEFNPKFFHKKGALAAARQGDNVNPSKASSGSQFYIVQGAVYDSLRLTQMNQKITESNLGSAVQAALMSPEKATIRTKIDSLRKAKDNTALMQIWEELKVEAQQKDPSLASGFSDLQKKAYSTIGGTPHLDGAYTVFGEIYEGLNIIDSIAAVKGDRNNRPLEDVQFTIKMIK